MVMKNKTNELLLRKCFRDIFHNLKQFIAIIFIVAVAVTLFIGLEANSKEFSKRVNKVYEAGNISDLWITFNPGSEGLTDTKKDYENIVSLNGGNASLVEKRFYFSANIENTAANAIISKDFPKINTAYNYEKGESFNSLNNFFFIDKDFVDRYEILTGEKLELGDILSVSFDLTMFESILNELDENLEIYLTDFFNFINNLEIIPSELKDFLNNYQDDIINEIENFFNNYSNNPYISFDLEVNGLMSHPENIQTSTFNSSSFLVSSELLFNNLVDRVLGNVETSLNNITNNNYASQIDNIILEIKNRIEDSSLEEDVLDLLVNQFVLKLGEGIDINDLTNKISDYYNDQNNTRCSLIAITNLNNMPSNMVIQSDIIQSKQLAYCFPLIFFLVAILVVLTTISQLILKERTEIGTFKSLGFSKISIFTYYMLMMSITTLFGVILGLIIGPILLPQVMNIKYDILYSLVPIGYSFPFLSSFLVIIGVFLVTVFLTYILIYKELSLTPAKSMRPSVPKINLKEKEAKPKNISLMMALRNIRVHIFKSIMVIVGVMGCTGLLICGMGIDDVLNYGKNNDLNGFFGSDVQVTFNANTLEGSVDPSVFKDSEGNEIIDKWEEYSMSQVNASKENSSYSEMIYLFYFSESSTNFKFNHWEIEENTCALAESKAKNLGIKVGDYITFTSDNTEYKLKVVDIFYTFTLGGVFIYKESVPNLLPYVTNAWVSLKEGVSYSEAKEILTPATNENNPYSFITSAMVYPENVDRIDGYMTSVKSMTNTIKVFAIILAVIVLINLSILNFRERLRDLATLKVLGFSTFEISKSLIYETMILTIIGALFGLALGFPLEMIVLMTNQTPIISYHYTIFLLTFVYSLLISLVTALVVNILMSFSIRKISMSESLKSIE